MKTILALLFIGLTSGLFSQAYKFDTVITGLNGPIQLAFLENNNILITQKEGQAVIYNLNGQFVSNFWNFTDSTISDGERGLLGVCKDLNYVSNHYVYFFYTHLLPLGIRVVRLTVNNNVGINPVILFAFHPPSFTQIHKGGNLRCASGNKLFISIGNDAWNANSQSLTTAYGKIHRINTDGTIPKDNPFYDDGNPATGNDDRIWAYGIRNTFDFCISPFNDSIYGSENGTLNNDEVNFIRRGKNYGFPNCAGYCNPYNPLYQQPMCVFDHPGISAIVTGIIIYNGSVFPELYGKLLVIGTAGVPQGGLFSCTLGNSPFNDTVANKQVIADSEAMVGMQQSLDGNIYTTYIRTNGSGKICRLSYDLTAVNDPSLPVGFSMSQNYPNPFNPTTSIKYEIPKQSHVSLKVYNVLGMEIASLVNETKLQGSYEVNWDASAFPSGVYFYELQAGEYKERKKMVLIK